MLTVFIIILVFVILLCVFHVLTKSFLNPYKLIFVFGRKGSGKSILLTKLINKYVRLGWECFTNEASVVAKFPPRVGAISYVSAKDLFKVSFPERSCIFLDEVSLVWDNRDFKTMDKRIVEWFRYQRKKKCRVYLFSQTFDVDKKIRDLADDMYLVNKFARVFVVARHIIRKPVVVHPSPDAPARIDDDMIVDGPLLWLFGGLQIAYIPLWCRFYDTNNETEHVASPPPAPQ